MDPSKLTEAAAGSLQAAVQLAKDNQQGVVAPAHLFSALLDPATNETGRSQQTLLHSILNKGKSIRRFLLMPTSPPLPHIHLPIPSSRHS
jgi:hypothetical protein